MKRRAESGLDPSVRLVVSRVVARTHGALGCSDIHRQGAKVAKA